MHRNAGMNIRPRRRVRGRADVRRIALLSTDVEE